MATIGEIARWLSIHLELIWHAVVRGYRRVVSRLLRSDVLVARSERKFHALLESAPDAIVIVDWHGHIQLVNAQTERMFGYDRKELTGKNIGTLIPQRLQGKHREHLRRYLRSPRARPMGGGIDLYGRRKDGSEVPVEISLGPLQTDQGLLVSAAIRDVTQRKRADHALREAEQRFHTAFEEAPVGMALVSLDGRLQQVNHAMSEITGHSREQLEATTLDSISHPGDTEYDREERARLIRGDASHYRVERRLMHADGHPVPVDMSVAVICDSTGAPSHLLAHAHDITERKRFEGQLQYLADHDGLTGMFNRRRFEHELERELARAARYGLGGALLAIDLDHFKYINDSLGHSVGDELISRAATIFRAHLRETDIIARLGGDEFAVILPGTSAADAQMVAEKLLSTLRREGRIETVSGSRRVTASIGVAAFTSESVTSDEMLIEADIAMYDAKEAGRNRVGVYDRAQERQKRMQARLTWAERISDALETERFVLHAQPIISLAGDDVPRHELLIRMLGEADDLIPPGTFLYIAERFDLIQQIDRWVIERAIELLAAERSRGREANLAINLSAKSITDPSLPAFVADQLSNAGIDGRGLCVEVTETAAIVNVDRAKRFAELLGEFGCEFALDDFGAGFASFYYLKHMVFDYVKIDGEFIRSLPQSHVNRLVVQSVVDIARGLGKRTIAEFVGDRETTELLKRYGVDFAQGFYLAKPEPLDRLALGRAPQLPHAQANSR